MNQVRLPPDPVLYNSMLTMVLLRSLPSDLTAPALTTRADFSNIRAHVRLTSVHMSRHAPGTCAAFVGKRLKLCTCTHRRAIMPSAD